MVQPAHITTRRTACVAVVLALGLLVGLGHVSRPSPPATVQVATIQQPASSGPGPATVEPTRPDTATLAAASELVRTTVAVDDTSAPGSIPSAALAAYQRAAAVINAADTTCNLSWQLIAAIGRVESDHGRFGGNVLDNDGVARPGIYGIPLDGSEGTRAISDTDAGQYDNDPVWDRAVGPMQFIPSTWSVVGVDADGDGVRDPQNIHDASLAAAVYLCSADDDLATPEGQRGAVLRYNHSTPYLQTVLGVMDAYSRGDYTPSPNQTLQAQAFTPDVLPAGSSAGEQVRQRTVGSARTRATKRPRSRWNRAEALTDAPTPATPAPEDANSPAPGRPTPGGPVPEEPEPEEPEESLPPGCEAPEESDEPAGTEGGPDIGAYVGPDVGPDVGAGDGAPESTATPQPTAAPEDDDTEHQDDVGDETGDDGPCPPSDEDDADDDEDDAEPAQRVTARGRD